jgi:peptidase M28-like protein
VREVTELGPVPTAAQMMADIEAVLAFGIRRPGHAGDRRAEEWAARRFAEIGLDDVTLEPVELPMWESGPAILDVWPATDPAVRQRFSGFALPYTQACTELERDLVPAGAAEVRDRIVVEPVSFIELPQSLLRDGATFAFDPDGEFDAPVETSTKRRPRRQPRPIALVQTLPFGPAFNSVGDAAVDAGAAGYIGVLTGVPWETCEYYVPYDAQQRPLSGLWLSRSDGISLQRLLDAGPHRARLSVAARTTTVRCHNIVGRLPGTGDETVIVGSHHDAPWASAVEDASGMALVLAQAAYWAGVPAGSRPHNLTFLLTAGHMAGGAGTRSYVERHAAELDRVVLEVHLEHAAAEVRGDGERLELTGEPEPRWWFTSTDPGLEAAVADALRTEDLRRSFVLKPTVFGAAPTTDGSAFYLAGVPIVHFLTAPMYLFDAADTIDKIHVPSLEPVTRAAIRIIESVRGRTAAGLRAGAADDTGSGAAPFLP